MATLEAWRAAMCRRSRTSTATAARTGPTCATCLRPARQQLGDEVILFTTDPPDLVHLGSLPGDEVFTCAPSVVMCRMGRQIYQSEVPVRLHSQLCAPRQISIELLYWLKSLLMHAARVHN